MIVAKIEFPQYKGSRCLMMPYIQGEPDSVPKEYAAYYPVIEQLVFNKGDIGFLTIDESPVVAGVPHRGARAKTSRALHTEAGVRPQLAGSYGWGWGSRLDVQLERSVEVLIASNIDDTCAVWDAVHENTSDDGDIGEYADQYPYTTARFLKAGEVARIGILTPHESLPIRESGVRQFIRIVSKGVHGREEYFTRNPIMDALAGV